MWPPPTRGLAGFVAALCLLERLAGPVALYLLVRHQPAGGVLLVIAVGALLSLRGAIQRSLTVRNEAALYRRAVGAILGGDVLQPAVLPDAEARAGLFEGLHRIAVLFADTLPNFAANAIAALVLTIAVAMTEPVDVTLVAALTLALGAVVLFRSRRWVERAHAAAWARWDDVADSVGDACDGRLELVAAGRDADFLVRFSEMSSLWADEATRAGRLAGLLGRVPMALLGAAVGGTVLVDAWRRGLPWSDAALQAGLLASVTPAFVGVARGLQELVSNEQRLRLAIRVVDSAIVGGRGGTRPPPSSPACVELSDVHFAYGHDRQEALRGVSLTWRSGELLVVTGSNGSGKSTCLRAMLGLGSPSRGTVKVDGVPLDELELVAWRRAITFLPQRAYLPPRQTVRESLRFADLEVSEDVMTPALERVGMLARLRTVSADPLDARVGDLSVGERQRIGLARMLCRSAPLVVLDEPDANLDRSGIELVCKLVVELRRTRMVLVVAHTPELLAVADRVIELEAGRVRAKDPAESAVVGSAQSS